MGYEDWLLAAGCWEQQLRFHASHFLCSLPRWVRGWAFENAFSYFVSLPGGRAGEMAFQIRRGEAISQPPARRKVDSQCVPRYWQLLRYWRFFPSGYLLPWHAYGTAATNMHISPAACLLPPGPPAKVLISIGCRFCFALAIARRQTHPGLASSLFWPAFSACLPACQFVTQPDVLKSSHSYWLLALGKGLAKGKGSPACVQYLCHQHLHFDEFDCPSGH